MVFQGEGERSSQDTFKGILDRGGRLTSIRPELETAVLRRTARESAWRFSHQDALIDAVVMNRQTCGPLDCSWDLLAVCLDSFASATHGDTLLLGSHRN